MKAPDKDKPSCAGKEFGAMIQSEIVGDHSALRSQREPSCSQQSQEEETRPDTRDLQVESPHESRWIEAREGIDYDQTYAPVATWESIRLLLGMVLKNKWKTKQLDYVLAFPQAPVTENA
jgi:hypothetical protein